MKENRYIKWILALTFCIVVFAVGFFFGHSGKWHSVRISPAVPTEYHSSAAELTVTPESRTIPSEAKTEKININNASREELATLPGIGTELAGRIVEYRETYGDFICIDEIIKVRGIGKEKLAAIQDLITV